MLLFFLFVFFLNGAHCAERAIISWNQTEAERAQAIDQIIQAAEEGQAFVHFNQSKKDRNFAAKFEYYVDLLNLRNAVHIVWAVAAVAQATGDPDYIAWGQHIIDSYWSNQNYIRLVFGFYIGSHSLNEKEERINSITQSLRIKAFDDDVKRLRDSIIDCARINPEASQALLEFLEVESVDNITPSYVQEFLRIEDDIDSQPLGTIQNLLRFGYQLERYEMVNRVLLSGDSPLAYYHKLYKEFDPGEALFNSINMASKKNPRMWEAYKAFVKERGASLNGKRVDEILESFLRVCWSVRIERVLQGVVAPLMFYKTPHYIQWSAPQSSVVREYGAAFLMLCNPNWWISDAVMQSSKNDSARINSFEFRLVRLINTLKEWQVQSPEESGVFMRVLGIDHGTINPETLGPQIKAFMASTAHGKPVIHESSHDMEEILALFVKASEIGVLRFNPLDFYKKHSSLRVCEKFIVEYPTVEVLNDAMTFMGFTKLAHKDLGLMCEEDGQPRRGVLYLDERFGAFSL